jgi:heme-degrading monooxygenase HmoA
VFAVIFEVEPIEERRDEYLSLAKFLKPKLEAIDGFIEIDRLGSARSSRRLLSLSTWRDEKAVVRWRTQAEHHAVQEKGRAEIFADYHLRVGEVTSDTHPPEGVAVEQKRFDETETGPCRAMTITEMLPGSADPDTARPGPLAAQLGLQTHAEGLGDVEEFQSLYHRGKMLLLASWRDAASACLWTPRPDRSISTVRHRQVRIIRDYGMFERGEAPQFYPAMTPRAVR